MFIIEKPQLLYLLLLLVPFAAAFYLNMYRKRKKLSGAGRYPLLKKQIPEYSTGKQHLKFIMLMVAYSLLVFCLANPQLGTSVKKAERKGVDVMVALDISNSMNSNDIQPSRLMRAKQAVIRILDKMESDRIGLVIFAGDAFLQLPLTTDYSAAKLFIGNIQTGDMSRQGTAIGKAIELCAQNFDPKYENARNKAIIVISDGENHEDDAVGAARDAAKKGIVVSTVGMGSPQGAPIPEYRNGQVVSYKRDAEGNVVITRMNRAMMEDIAKAGKGFYVEANNISSGVETVFEKLSELDKVAFETRNISDYETRYPYFLALALVLIFAEMLLFEKRNRIFNRRRLFGIRNKKEGAGALRTLCVILIISVFAIGNLSAQTAIPTHNGNRHYADKNFHEAEVSYLKALSRDSNYHKARYNLGNAQYEQRNYEQAIANYTALTDNPNLSKDEKADLYHNLGNAFVQQKDYQKAIESYIRALQNKPGKTDTRYNLTYAQKMLKQQENQQQQNQQQDQQQQHDRKQEQPQKRQNPNQDQQQQNQQQQQQQAQNQNGKDPQQGQQMTPRQKAKRQEAERILRALENQEKNTLEKIKKNQDQNGGSPVEKDW